MGPPGNAARLTSGRVESLKPRDHRYEVNDPSCAGLQLRIAETGVKSWHWRFYWHGKRARLVLGVWPKTSLAEAHEKAEAARALLRRGIDSRRAGITVASRVKPERSPAEVASGHSVDHLAREFMSRHIHRRRRRPEYVQRILNAEVLPRWGSRDARTIKPREVIELLDEIADRAPVMANRVAGTLSQLFRFSSSDSGDDAGTAALSPRRQGETPRQSSIGGRAESLSPEPGRRVPFSAAPARAAPTAAHTAAPQRARVGRVAGDRFQSQDPEDSGRACEDRQGPTSCRCPIGRSRNFRSSR